MRPYKCKSERNVRKDISTARCGMRKNSKTKANISIFGNPMSSEIADVKTQISQECTQVSAHDGVEWVYLFRHKSINSFLHRMEYRI